MNFTEQSCRDFVKALAGSDPVPGGGGASALAAAIGTALGNMVGSLTVGKKKYADVQEEILELKASADKLQEELLELVRKDAECFEPLSRAYGMPKSTPEEVSEREKVMEECLDLASSVPMEIMRKCCEAIDVTCRLSEIGTAIAISDVGVSATLLKASLQGASLNVYINTKLMKDRAKAEALNEEAHSMLSEYGQKADAAFDKVRKSLFL